MTTLLTNGNILNSTADVLVNPTNCVGPMGKGLAKEYKDRWPEVEYWYKKQLNGISPGGVHFVLTNDGKLVANVATKAHWKSPSKLDWIKTGCHNLRVICEDLSMSE